MRKKHRYFTAFFRASLNGETIFLGDANVVNVDGRYLSRSKTIQDIKKNNFYDEGYSDKEIDDIAITLTNVIEYKNEKDYLDYTMEWRYR